MTTDTNSDHSVAVSAEETIAALRAENLMLRVRMETIANMLLEEARNRQWCSEYDDFAQNVNDTIGAEVLLRLRAEYTVNFSEVMNMEAVSPEHAEEQCSAELYRLGQHSHFNIHSIEIGDCEVAE